MDQKLKQAVREIEDNGGVEILRKCVTLKARHNQLLALLPEVWLWNPMQAKRLVFRLQRKHGLDFGVCDFYKIAMRKDKQYCNRSGKKVECLCIIPQPYCQLRDPKGVPKYPELMETFALGAVN